MVFARAYLTCSICSHLERDTSFDATEQLGEVYLSTFIVLNEYNLSIVSYTCNHLHEAPYIFEKAE